jgi:hypothetical protein
MNEDKCLECGCSLLEPCHCGENCDAHPTND